MRDRVERGDGSLLMAAIEAHHPDPFRYVSPDTLRAAATRVDALDTGKRSVLTVELMRFLALLGARNGHTAIHPFGDHPAGYFAYPLGLYEFEDGVFVIAAERDDLVGAELVAVDGTPIDEVLGAVTPLIAHDNEWTIRARRPTFVVQASVLGGLGLVDGDKSATFRLRSRDGAVADVALGAIATSDHRARLSAGSVAQRSGPAYSRRSREPHWAEVAANGRAVHVGYNVTRGPIDGFARDVETLAAPARVGVVILDLRHNGGGDNRTYGPLLNLLERLGNDMRLAVLTSRTTFSAAMQFVVDLERNTPAVFVGEPTGGSPNQYGDATAIALPSSRLTAFVATIAWMTAGESDDRLTREPDIHVANEAMAFFAGDDPTLDIAVATLS
jgi:hypothetical protein